MNKINPVKKAIIIAGGLGRRLMPITNDKPKCMLKIGDKTILQSEIEALKSCGIDDIAVVTGYQKEKINYPDLKYYHDENYHIPGIVRGLFCAEKEMADGFVFSYSDIIYGQDVVKKLLGSQADIALVIDTAWREQYLGREKHPITEAELVKVKDGRIIKIGKDVVGVDETQGEFIGLAKFSKKGAEILKSNYHGLLREYQDKPNMFFQNAKEFERAYLTDIMQELIDRGEMVVNIDIQGNWIEIDTEDDLERAKKFFKERSQNNNK